jgi:hypothetical protein
MLTAIALVQFRHYWKSFAHRLHRNFSLTAWCVNVERVPLFAVPPAVECSRLVDLSFETIR